MTAEADGARDRRLLLAAGFLRATATALVGVLLGIHLARVGLDPSTIGLVAGAGLTGAALGSLVVTVAGDRLGRRRCLLALSAITAVGTTVLAAASRPGIVAAAAFVGMVNAMGRDRGAATVVEQAVLPATTSAAGRTRAFAWYTALQDAGAALGSLLAGLPSFVAPGVGGSAAAAADRVALGLLPAAAVAGFFLYRRLSPGIEADGAPSPGLRLSPASRRVVARLSALFALDGLGGGFLVTTLLAYFFFERFGIGAGEVGLLFFGARLANVGSHFGAAWLARRIGLVNTMVFTHVPSSLLLVAVAFVPSFPLAAGLFLLRECLVEMDVPTRSSYVMALVEPGERTAAAGVTSLVRLASWAVGPLVAGALMQGVDLVAPLLVGAGLKLVYDGLLYLGFRRLRPPEERV